MGYSSWTYLQANLTVYNELMASDSIVDTLRDFKADTGGTPHHFCSDFDKKLIGGKALQWIFSNDSNIIVAPTDHPDYDKGLHHGEIGWQGILVIFSQACRINAQSGTGLAQTHAHHSI